MSDRGMKKYNPFKSLKGQDVLLDQVKKDRLKIPRPILETDEIERLESVLSSLEAGETITIHIYNNGFIEVKNGVITKIKDHLELKIGELTEKINYADIVDLMRD